MYAALCVNLRDASELVHAICKGEEPKRGMHYHYNCILFHEESKRRL